MPAQAGIQHAMKVQFMRGVSKYRIARNFAGDDGSNLTSLLA
jgi:hypothetical protein